VAPTTCNSGRTANNRWHLSAYRARRELPNPILPVFSYFANKTFSILGLTLPQKGATIGSPFV